MEPASTIIATLGGVGKVAEIVGRHRTRVSNWKRPKHKGGTGGQIPRPLRAAIFAAATERGSPITRAMIDGLQLAPPGALVTPADAVEASTLSG
jgi:hypothetical protein